jgi:hypothetical protein
LGEIEKNKNKRRNNRPRPFEFLRHFSAPYRASVFFLYSFRGWADWRVIWNSSTLSISFFEKKWGMEHFICL